MEKNEWILADRDLPVKNEYVRVTVDTGEEWTGFYRCGKWYVLGVDGQTEADVTAWQKRQPYRAVSGDVCDGRKIMEQVQRYLAAISS